MGTITIVGLGPGAVGHLSLETMGLLQNCAQVILRTAVHPTVAELEKQNVKFTSCDDLYEKAASFEEVYNSVVERVLAAAQNGDVVAKAGDAPLSSACTSTATTPITADAVMILPILNQEKLMRK